MMDLLADSPHRRIILDPRQDRWSNNPKTQTFTVLHAFSPPYSTKVFAILSIEIDVSILASYDFLKDDPSSPDYFLVAGDGSMIYKANQEYDTDYIDLQLLQKAAVLSDDEAAETGYITRNGEKKLAIVSRIQPSDWYLYCLIPTAQLNEPYMGSYCLMVGVDVGLLLLVLLAISVTANFISKPLTTLSMDIANINLHNINHALTSPERDYSVEELKRLDAAYREMLVRINKSISYEMKAYLRALQSQMNPHFLYNMLSAIVESGEEENSPRTVAMCIKLTDMMRYIADYDNDRVSIEQELQHTRNYLDLMKERYESCFSYSILADECVLPILVPKLIVQPLAENCFKHGFSGCRPPWHIDIHLRRLSEGWELTVQDNGIGISLGKIVEIKQRLSAYTKDVPGSFNTLKADGMGLINSILRLTLLQKSPPTYEIKNLPGGGTIIRIGGEIDDSGISR